MADGGDAHLAIGEQALEAGRWADARRSFEAALEQEETAEALRGLAEALWWLGETKASVRLRERAYAGFRRLGEDGEAALAAIHLSLTYRASLGSESAAQGWLGRAARLVEEAQLAPLEGWVLLARASAANDDDDVAEGERCARAAREIARRTADADLELCALSEIGTSLVGLGRVEEGGALLDEAMAGSLAGEGAPDTVVYTSCRTITTCSRAAEVRRAGQWIRAADEFTARYGSPHLYAVCRTHHGSVLFCTGRWAEAEEELHVALQIGAAGEPAVHAEALAKLAELRLAQGRIDEAARLLAGLEDHRPAAWPLAALHLARGERARAASILRRHLGQIGENLLASAAPLELLVEVELEDGAAPAAAEHARGLLALGERLGCEVVLARGRRALGRVLSATGSAVAATRHLETALALFTQLEMPFEVARVRLLLAQALHDGAPEPAIAEARACLATFERLGAARDADRAAALLRSLGVSGARGRGRGTAALTKREREILGLLGEGLSNPQIAERLFLSRKTVEHHVHSVLSKLDLTNRAEAAAFAVRQLERDSATT